MLTINILFQYLSLYCTHYLSITVKLLATYSLNAKQRERSKEQQEGSTRAFAKEFSYVVLPYQKELEGVSGSAGLTYSVNQKLK